MRILITGFEPFGGEKINPSEKILKRIAKSKLASEFKVDTLLLPVSYKRCVDILKELYKENKYDFALHLGQAGGRSSVVLEALGINLMDSKQPDNDGYIADEEEIIPSGQLALKTKINVKALSEKLSKSKIPNIISYHAGLYVCNTVNYYSLYSSEKYLNPSKTLFVHMPFLPEQVIDKNFLPGYKASSMSLTLQTRAVVKIVKTVLEVK